MKIVLAYSGGLDTSVILKWLKEKFDADVIAFCANIGQEEELEGLEEKALATGASRCVVSDLREEFASDFIFPLLQAGALYENQYYLGTAIARPLIAKHLVEIARQYGATAIAHGATGKGNDQVRFELTAAALAPELQVIAPWRLADFRSQFPGRKEMIAYAKANQIPVEATAEKPFSMDRNLLHISYEAGVLEDVWLDASAPEMRSMYKLSVAPELAPDAPQYVELDFEQGRCTTVRAEGIRNSGQPMTPLQVMQVLNELGGAHGVGRVDIVENRFVGMKSRGVYETPGGAILHHAHMQLESITLDREVMRLKHSLLPKYAELVYYGFWFSPERLMLQAAITESQKYVNGTVRVKLYKGSVITAGRKSPDSLYSEAIATMESDNAHLYNQDDATGFIRLQALRLKVAARSGRNYCSHG